MTIKTKSSIKRGFINTYTGEHIDFDSFSYRYRRQIKYLKSISLPLSLCITIIIATIVVLYYKNTNTNTRINAGYTASNNITANAVSNTVNSNVNIKNAVSNNVNSNAGSNINIKNAGLKNERTKPNVLTLFNKYNCTKNTSYVNTLPKDIRHLFNNDLEKYDLINDCWICDYKSKPLNPLKSIRHMINDVYYNEYTINHINWDYINNINHYHININGYNQLTFLIDNQLYNITYYRQTSLILNIPQIFLKIFYQNNTITEYILNENILTSSMYIHL